MTRPTDQKTAITEKSLLYSQSQEEKAHPVHEGPHKVSQQAQRMRGKHGQFYCGFVGKHSRGVRRLEDG